MKNSKIWFKAKRYGWGWTPITWEGWVIIILYVAALYVNIKNVDMYSNSVNETLINIAIPFVINTFYLLVICYSRGEKPRWRWGK
ncbi:MAG: hypothetical protein ACYCZW_02140 [Minisyncoccota bacterium]